MAVERFTLLQGGRTISCSRPVLRKTEEFDSWGNPVDVLSIAAVTDEHVDVGNADVVIGSSSVETHVTFVQDRELTLGGEHIEAIAQQLGLR